MASKDDSKDKDGKGGGMMPLIIAAVLSIVIGVGAGYGTIVMRSSRPAYNAVQSILYDLVIDRNLASRNPYGVEFDKDATPESIKAFEESFFDKVVINNADGTQSEYLQRRRSSPDEFLWVKGGKFTAFNNKQALLDSLEDVHLAIDRLELCFGTSLSLSGFRAAKRVTGQMQERWTRPNLKGMSNRRSRSFRDDIPPPAIRAKHKSSRMIFPQP